MKYLLAVITLVLCASCSDSQPAITNMRINHYRAPATGVSDRFVYLVQEGDEIGTDQWEYFYSGITGFEYEPGYIYSLSIQKEPIEDPPADGSSIRYTLEEIISKEKVADSTTFPVRLKNSSTTSTYVTGDLESGFKILKHIAIYCNNLCDELSQKLQSDTGVIGIFRRDGPEAYTLINFGDAQ